MSALVGVILAICGAQLYLFSWYVAHRPTLPDPKLNFVVPLHNHGTDYFLTLQEAKGVGLLWCVFFAVFVILIGVRAIGFAAPPYHPIPSVRRHLAQIDSWKGFHPFLVGIGFAITTTVIWLFGRLLVLAAISSGIDVSR
jgi:hypothetical protein